MVGLSHSRLHLLIIVQQSLIIWCILWILVWNFFDAEQFRLGGTQCPWSPCPPSYTLYIDITPDLIVNRRLSSYAGCQNFLANVSEHFLDGNSKTCPSRIENLLKSLLTLMRVFNWS